MSAEAPILIPSHTPRPAAAFLCETVMADQLQALATRAVDAARSAGATYADVRVSEQHRLVLRSGRILLYSEFMYGVRALVDGCWSFSYGRTATPDAVTQCAKAAVGSARTVAILTKAISASSVIPEWVPAPVVTGTWRSPVKVDPFTVPIEQQEELQSAVQIEVERTPGALGMFEAEWIRETRVFAATTGSLVTQELYRAMPVTHIEVIFGRSQLKAPVPLLRLSSGGYETLAVPELLDQAKQAAEESARLVRLPSRQIDVGRYPIVLDGNIMGSLLGTLVGPSLELDRVLGQDPETAGTSRMTLEQLGTQVAGKALTLKGGRAVPSVSAVQWDDEGNVPQEHTVIRDGILTDFHTSGRTVSAMSDWYAKHGQPVRSNGCALSVEADRTVVVQPPHVTMTPSQSNVSFEDLYKDLPRGIVALKSGSVSPDQQLSSGSMDSEYGGLFEVSRGKIVGRIRDMGLQFSTAPFLKSLAAVGGVDTVCQSDVYTSKGMPWVEVQHSATAPAALFTQVNLIEMQLKVGV